jgi:hypothetical protein
LGDDPKLEFAKRSRSVEESPDKKKSPISSDCILLLD